MKLYFPHKITLAVVMLMVFQSCVKDSDFTLEDNISKTTTVDTTLVETTFNVSRLLGESSSENAQNVLIDSINFDLEAYQLTAQPMKSLSFVSEFDNTIGKDFKVDVEFRNNAGISKYKVHVPITSGSTEFPTSVKTVVLIERPEIERLKDVTHLVYALTISDAPLSSPPKNQELLTMKATANINFED